MVAMLAAAALICAASLAVGGAIVSACRWAGSSASTEWSWLAPSVGIAALISAAALVARLPGRAATAAAVLVALTAAALVYLAVRGPAARGSGARVGLGAGLLAALFAALPFAVNARVGILGVGLVNDDMASHLLIADWVQNDTEPTPSLVDGGYPLGPHSLVAALAELLGADPVDVFAGLTLAIAALAALTALHVLGGLPPGRRVGAAALAALPFLGAAYLAQGAFKEPLQALLLIGFALGLREAARAWREPPSPGAGRLARRWPGLRRETLPLAVAALPLAVLAAGAVFNYSFPGLLWLGGAALILWALRGAPLGWIRPALPLIAVALIAVAVATLPDWGRIAEFADFRAFERSGAQALGNLRHSVSPLELLGVWPSGEFRISPADASLPAVAFYLGAVLGAGALGAGLWRALRERALELPAALVAALGIYVGAVLFGTPYTSAKGLAIAAPVAMLIALRGATTTAWLPSLAGPLGRLARRRPLARLPGGSRIAEAVRRRELAGLVLTGLGAAFVVAAAISSLLVLRQAPVGPDAHATELERLRGEVQGSRVLFLGRDDFIAWELRGAIVKTHLQNYYDVGQVDARFQFGGDEEKFDFDAVPPAVLERFRYVLTTRTTYASHPPHAFRPVARTRSFVLWKRRGAVGPRETLDEGAAPGATLGCDGSGGPAEERGSALVWPRPPVAAGEGGWSPEPVATTGAPATIELELPAGAWRISLAYDSPRVLELTAGGPELEGGERTFRMRPNLDFRGPTPYFPAGRVDLARAGTISFAARLNEAPALGRLLGAEGEAHLRGVAAAPAGDTREAALADACGEYVDWYREAR